MPYLNAGRLRKHIEVWRYESYVNEAGSDVNQLRKIKTLYGEIRPQRGSEYAESYKDTHNLTVKITVRFWDGMRPTDVLVYHGRQYEIQSIINVEEYDRYMEIMCVESNEKGRQWTE